MSLIPMESLMVILQQVAIEQATSTDRLSLAIPMTDLLSYYDSRLLDDALTVPEGLLLTLKIPLVSKQTVFTLFEAKIIPMPYPQDPQSALTWSIEAPYLAISEDLMESSVLTSIQFENCLGSSRYRICSETLPTEIGHSSCLATLYFDSPLDALSVCETSPITLPSIEQATNLGFGIWLITSANADFSLRKVRTSSHQGPSFPGCRICLITLECGVHLMTDNLKIRSDLSSCNEIPPIKLKVSLPNPLNALIMEVPPLEDLPLFTSNAEAGVNLLKEVRKELIKSSRVREVNQLVEIARPVASDMRLMKPALTREFNQYVPFKISFGLSLIVFVVSTILHLLFMYIYHRFNLAAKLFPSFTDHKKQKIPAKPVVLVPPEHQNAVSYLRQKFGKRFHFGFDLPKNSSTGNQLVASPPYTAPQDISSTLRPSVPRTEMTQSCYEYSSKFSGNPRVFTSQPNIGLQLVQDAQLLPDQADNVSD